LSFSYRLDRQAERYVLRLDERSRLRIVQALRALCEDPYDNAWSAALHGPLAGLRRARVGQWRIIFQVIDDQLLVLVLSVGPRGDVYKD
jgi:mRNA interferase RelE/StbE